MRKILVSIMLLTTVLSCGKIYATTPAEAQAAINAATSKQTEAYNMDLTADNAESAAAIYRAIAMLDRESASPAQQAAGDEYITLGDVDFGYGILYDDTGGEDEYVSGSANLTLANVAYMQQNYNLAKQLADLAASEFQDAYDYWWLADDHYQNADAYYTLADDEYLTT